MNERYQLIQEQKQNILNQIEKYNMYLKEIEFKEWYYQTALKNGTEKDLNQLISDKPTFDIDKIPENISIK